MKNQENNLEKDNSFCKKQSLSKGTFSFRVDTMGLLTEICDCGLDKNMGVLKIPLNIFKNLLGEVAERASEINDPKLNIIMLKLALYEVPPHEIPNAIEYQMKLRDEINSEK